MNSRPQPDTMPALPGPILTTLRHLIRRARRLILLRGSCATVAAGLAAFLAVMAIDASVPFLARWPRWLMTLLAYGAWAASLAWFLVRPLARSFTLAGIARLIETHHPELQERLSSVVQILGSRDIPAIRGSEALIRALTEEAIHDAVQLKPRQEISFRKAVPFGIATGVLVLVLAGLWVAHPRQTRFLLARATAPFLNLSNVHAMDLVVEPGDTLIASGSSLHVAVRAPDAAVTSARLLHSDAQGRELVTEMAAAPAATNEPGRRFVAVLPAVQRGFQYRVQAGDALTRFFQVRVAIPPVIRHLDLHYRFPEYARLGALRERDGSGAIRALAGTEVTVSAWVNKPVASALLPIVSPSATNTHQGVARQDKEGLCYDFTFTLPRRLNGTWTLNLRDEIGLGNAPFDYAIQAIPDQPPSARILRLPQREMRLSRQDRLPFGYAAEDDFEVASATLALTVAGMSNEVLRPLPVRMQAGQGTKALQGEAVLTMNDPLFASAPRIAFRLRATDNLPRSLQGPQAAESETYTIVLDELAPSWKEQVLSSQERRAQEGLKQTQQKLTAALDQARTLETPLGKPGALAAETAKRVDTLQDTLASADQSLRDVATDVGKGFFESLATNLNALADQHVGKAENLAGQIRLVNTPAERTALNSNVTTEVETALKAVAQALLEHDAARAAVRHAVELEKLADQQAALARTLAEQERAAPPAATQTTAVAQAAAASNAWQRAQDQVADRLAALARATPETARGIAAATSNLAVRTAAQANRLAAEQETVAALTRQQAEALQQQERKWREMAAQQQQLAEQARRDPAAALHAKPAQEAARELSAGAMERAVQAQAEAADGLRREADRLLKEAAAPAAASAETEADKIARQTAAAEEKTRTGLELAHLSADQAEQAAKRLDQKAAGDEAASRKASGALPPEAARELARQAAATRQAATEAKQWSQAASQAADEARKLAGDVRRAVEKASRKDQPEAARKEAGMQAGRDAERIGQLAEDARTAAQQAAARGTLPESPQARAVQAEARAANALREARQSELQAEMTAARARRQADDAEQRVGQVAATGGNPPQIEDARNRALEAREQAATATQAAAKAREETLKTQEQAQAARLAADKALIKAAAAKPEPVQDTAAIVKQAAAPKPAATSAPPQAQQAAQQAQEASRSAQQAAQQAQQAAQQANTTAQQGEQQAAAARQAAQQAQQAAQGAQQAAQQAQQAAQGAQQAAQQAQQAVQQAQQAAATSNPIQARKAEQDATKAAESAGIKAHDAARAASAADEAAARASKHLNAMRLATLAAQQDALRKQSAEWLGQRARTDKALRDALTEPLARRQQDLAAGAAQLAGDLNNLKAPEAAAGQAAEAAEATRQAAADSQKGDLPRALTAASESQRDLAQLADTLRTTPPAEATPEQLARHAALAEAAQRARTLAGQQAELGRQMEALATDRPQEALQERQAAVSSAIDDLAQDTGAIRRQAEQVLPQTQAPPQAGQAAQAAGQAMLASRQAADSLDQFLQPDPTPGRAPTASAPSPALSPARQQAGERARQAQQQAAQGLKQAAQTLQTAARTMSLPAAPNSAPPPPAGAQPSLAEAYQEAREAAATREAADAAQAASTIAQAAQEAARTAQALGANPRPDTMQIADGTGGGIGEDAQVSEDVPSLARRLGMKLQDWLRLHGELKDDVLQASHAEGPEEYRPLIKRYFNEISSHGKEEP